MHRLFSLVVAGGLVFGLATGANAQMSFSFGNPYSANGISIGTPYYNSYSAYGGGGIGYPYGGAYGPAASGLSPVYTSYYAPAAIGAYATPYGTTTYSSGYSGYVAPGTAAFSSGYYSPVYSGYGLGGGYRPASVWMGTSRPSTIWMGGTGYGGWRGGGFRRW